MALNLRVTAGIGNIDITRALEEVAPILVGLSLGRIV
jgi:hypothetical protein